MNAEMRSSLWLDHPDRDRAPFTARSRNGDDLLAAAGDADNELPDPLHSLLAGLLDHLRELDRHAKELEAQIFAWHRNNELSRKSEAVPGTGPLPDRRTTRRRRQAAYRAAAAPSQYPTRQGRHRRAGAAALQSRSTRKPGSRGTGLFPAAATR